MYHGGFLKHSHYKHSILSSYKLFFFSSALDFLVQLSDYNALPFHGGFTI